ncbi:MAG: sel1 repeat family protein, partial [Gammaproteobacteria bacterium]|nr:sel1 repeat family protein [Gammaproteobacteria bacterium]
MPVPSIKLLHVMGFILAVSGAQAMTPEETTLIANSAQRGSAGAQVLFAGIYKDGTGGYPQDDHLAAYWYEQAAEQGNAYAQQILADLYEQGKGVEKNSALAADWREKAANRGNIQAQLKLGKMYLYGTGSARDPAKAAQWLNRAAIEGNSEAQYLYAKMFQTGYGVAQNKEIADTWLAKSAAQGYEDAIRLVHFMENVGFQIEESFYRRPPDLEKLAQDGDTEAQYQLAIRCETGAYGQKKDSVSAIAWFKKAAEHGHALAIRSLAQIYLKGIEGVPADPEAARYWQTKLHDVP